MDGFEIISKLGDGSYSVVYKVKRKADDKIYALKKVRLQNLSDKEKENSLNEVRILASVRSTFVIAYKEAFIDENDQSLCIIMEYADKGDLYQKIVQFRKLKYLIEEVDVWRIFIQMTKGLKALHDLKILHRDLKSANIFLFSDGSAKIGDLNVSKVAHKGLGYTQTGTPYYTSPEVWNDEPYDSKSDIWSLACVLYEMLTLHPPFRAENMEGLYNKVIKGQYEKICDKYSKDISEMLKLLFKVKAKDRPSCGEILKHPLVQKRLEFFRSQAGNENIEFDDMDEGVLLRTIRIPKNILNLAEKLPESNYDYLPKLSKNNRNNKEANDGIFPDINSHSNFHKENNASYHENNKNNLNTKNINKINENKKLTNIKNKSKNLSIGKNMINNNLEHKTNNSLTKKNMIKNLLTDIQTPASIYKNNSEINKAKSIDKNSLNLPIHKKFKVNQRETKNMKVDNILKDLGVNINYDDYLQSIKNNKRNIALTISNQGRNFQKISLNKKLPLINKRKIKQ